MEDFKFNWRIWRNISNLVETSLTSIDLGYIVLQLQDSPWVNLWTSLIRYPRDRKKKRVTWQRICKIINARFEEHLLLFNLVFDLWLLWRFSFYYSQKKCRPLGSEALPEGIVSKTSNLEMRPLWGDVEVTNYFRLWLSTSFLAFTLIIYNLWFLAWEWLWFHGSSMYTPSFCVLF